jgi:hypothetical protein
VVALGDSMTSFAGFRGVLGDRSRGRGSGSGRTGCVTSRTC